MISSPRYQTKRAVPTQTGAYESEKGWVFCLVDTLKKQTLTVFRSEWQADNVARYFNDVDSGVIKIPPMK